MTQPLLQLSARQTQAEPSHVDFTLNTPLSILRQHLKADIAKLHDRIFDLQLCDHAHELEDVEEIITEITRKLNFLYSIPVCDEVLDKTAA